VDEEAPWDATPAFMRDLACTRQRDPQTIETKAETTKDDGPNLSAKSYYVPVGSNVVDSIPP